jgi:hypothetical protein
MSHDVHFHRVGALQAACGLAVDEAASVGASLSTNWETVTCGDCRMRLNATRYYEKAPPPAAHFDASKLEKLRMDLLHPAVLVLEVRALTFGATKHAPDGWRTVKHLRRIYRSALLRHLLADWQGEKTDDEMQVPHLAAVRACSMILLAADLEKIEETPYPCGDRVCRVCYAPAEAA